MMDVIECIGYMASGMTLYIMVRHGAAVASSRFLGRSSASTPAHDLKVAACLHASGRRTRDQLHQDHATGTGIELDASLMRLTSRGLVDREFVGGGKVPHFELTPEGATILADD